MADGVRRATSEAAPTRSDEAALTARLATWLSDQLGERVVVENVAAPDGTGFSSETVLYDAVLPGRREHHVLRRRPQGRSVFRHYDLRAQFEVMRRLGQDTRVPVPRVRWYEDDPSVLGSPFLVMDRVDGRVPADNPPFTMAGWLHDAPPEEQRAVVEHAIDALADLHLVDLDAIGLRQVLDRPEHGPTGLRQQIAVYEDLLAWGADGDPPPTVAAALAWLHEHLPDEADLPHVLTWGDARISNAIFDGTTPVALLDWEMATIGPPQVDLAWFLHLDEQFAAGLGIDPLPGFPSDDELVARYARRTGFEVGDLTWYRVWAGVRFSIVMMRIGQHVLDDNDLEGHEDITHNNLATRHLARILDLPSPGEPGLLG